ncbi:MAG TPA: hypothetical protein VMA72_22205 [Streptosporangiaceae bacterium]|nr:hypothetical protein [Streptosporangiaceae bacterium]
MTAGSRSTWARLAAAAATVVAAGATLATAAGPASANTTSAAAKVHAKYKVTGSTYIKAPNFTINLGPGTLRSTVDLKTGKLTASLSLPDATASFTEGVGIIQIPVTATTQFINDGPTTGKLNTVTGKVRTKSKITLRIVSLTVGGLNLPVGNSCQTKDAVVVRLASQAGFNVLEGGKLAGSYTIGDFSGCGLIARTLINATIPGGGNTIALKLGKAKVS